MLAAALQFMMFWHNVKSVFSMWSHKWEKTFILLVWLVWLALPYPVHHSQLLTVINQTTKQNQQPAWLRPSDCRRLPVHSL